MELNQYLEIRRCFNGVRQKAAASARIIFDEFAILCILHDRKGLSATEIATEQGISCPTMTHRGSHLTQLGYMARESSNEDHRRLKCTLTRKGSAYVTRIAKAIIDAADENSGLKELDAAGMIALIAKMGTLPLTADSLTLVCFAMANTNTMPIMSIVETTGLLQPTVSMAVLRLEGEGLIERSEASCTAGRRPMRRNSGCVLTNKGMKLAQDIAEKIKEL